MNLKWPVHGFSRNVWKYAFCVRSPGGHLNGFASQFDYRNTDIDSLLLMNCSEFCNSSYFTMNITKCISRQISRWSEKSNWPAIYFMDLFSARCGFVSDSSARKMTAALAEAGCKRQCISIEQDAMCFNVALSCVWRIHSSIINWFSSKVARQRFKLCDTIRRLYNRDLLVNNRSCLWEAGDCCSEQNSNLTKKRQKYDSVEGIRSVVADKNRNCDQKNIRGSNMQYKFSRLKPVFSGAFLEDNDGIYEIEISKDNTVNASL